MNSSELQLVEQTLKGLLTPDNAARASAEQQLGQLMSNKIGLVLCCSQLLTSVTDLNTLSYAAVIIKKVIKPGTDEEVSQVWKDATPEMKEKIKSNTMAALSSCKNKPLLKKIADVATYLIENIYGNNEKWDDALKYIINGFTVELTPETSLGVEIAVYILSKVFNTIQRDIESGIDTFVNGFNKFFKVKSLELKTNSTEAVCEILTGYLSKKNKKKFKEFIFYILQTILRCLEENDLNNLKISLFALSDLASTEASMLKKSFSDIFILMGKIYEKNDLDEDAIKNVSFEVLLSIIDKYPEVISKDKEKLSALINALFKYGMQIEDTIDEDWLTPKSTSISEESFIPEEKLDEALSLLDRLILAVGPANCLELTSSTVMELLNHSNEHWKYQYIAFMSIGKIIEYVEDINSIEKVIGIILSQVNNENPKIRFACLYCIYQLTDRYGDSFLDLYHKTVLPTINELFKKETVLRVLIQLCDTLQTILEKAPKSIVNENIQNFLDSVFLIFIKSEKECPAILREGIIDVLGELISATEDKFAPFSEKCFDILFQYLTVIIKSNDKNTNLFGELIDVITRVGKYCPEKLAKNSLDIAQSLILFQNNISNFKGNVGEFFESAWEKILPVIKTDHKDIIPTIIQSALKVITNPPEMAISSNPEKKFDVQAFIGDVDLGEKKVTLEKEKITFNTSETEEYTIFLEIFNLFLTELKDSALPYIDVVEQEAKRVLSYPNSDIRVEASRVFPNLIEVVKISADNSKVVLKLKEYLTVLVTAAKNDKENIVVSGMLDSINDLLKDQPKLLNEVELQQLFNELFQIFDKTEASRLSLLKEEKQKQKEIDEHANNPKDEEEDDDSTEMENLQNIKDEIDEIENVVTSFTDVVGAIFKSHKELSLPIIKKMLTEVLPKYLNDTSSNFEKKMGLFILDDMVEFLGQQLLSEVWASIVKIYLPFIESPICELRQAASYGLGQFVEHTKENYEPYANDIYNALQRGLLVPGDGADEDEYLSAQDNIVTAIGKMIKFQGKCYNISQLVPQWLSHLPILNDTVESPGMHDLLCDIIMTNPSVVFGANNENVSKVIRVLCKIAESSKLSNKDIDKKIEKILLEMKGNDTFKPFIEKAKSEAKKNVRVKIEKYFA